MTVIVKQAVTRVTVREQRRQVIVRSPGPKGRDGVDGEGVGGTPVHIGDTLPADPGDTYAWFQTGLGDNGEDFTLWIEDGKP